MIKIIQIDDVKIYDDYVYNYKISTFLQLSSWAKVKEPVWTSKRYFIYQDETQIGAFQVLYRKIVFSYKLAYICKGPLIEYKDKELVAEIFKAIKKLLKEQKCAKLIFDPPLTRDDQLLKIIPGKHSGFFKDMREIQPRYNMMFDISPELEVISSKFAKRIKTKYNQIDKLPLEVKNISEDEWNIYYQVMSESAQRNGIGVRPIDYFQKIIANLPSEAHIVYLNVDKAIHYSQEKIKSLNKEKDGLKDKSNCEEKIIGLENKIKKYQDDIVEFQNSSQKHIALAAFLDVYDKQVCHYLYGGSTNKYREYNPVLAMVKYGIIRAKLKGCTVYDLGGVSGNTDSNCKDPFWGLYSFKKEFGSYTVETIGEFSITIRPLLNLILDIAIKFRKFITHRRMK